MQKRKIKGLDHSVTSEQERAQKTAKAGRKGYSKKFAKESSRSRKRGKGGKANGGKKQQRGQRQTAYKLADLLPDETIKKLKEMGR